MNRNQKPILYYEHLNSLCSQFSGIKDVEHLVNILHINQVDMFGLLVPKYHTFYIKKKGKERIIHQPIGLLYSVQRKINEYLTASYIINHYLPNQLPVHSYIPRIFNTDCKGELCHRSIKTNALAHLGSTRLLKLDIDSFFESITREKIKEALQIVFPNSTSDCIEWLVHLTSYGDALPAGAPSSPMLSNLVFLKFDLFAKNIENVNYTRYGDDLTFSFPSGKISMRKTYNMVENELETMGFRLKKSKSQYVTMGKRFMVTGVVINEKLSVSRSYIKWIRAVIYDCESNGIQQASNKYAQLNIRKYSIFKIRKLRLLRLYCEISNVHKLESKNLITIFFIDSINGHLSFIDYIRGPNDTITKNLKDRFSSISSGHELTIEPNIFSSQDTLAYITNATSNSVAYYAYTFLRYSKYTDEEIDQLRKIFSNKRNKIEFNLIKDSLINQSAYFIQLYNYMIHNNRFEEFYSTMQDTDREALFKYDIGLNGQSPYMRFVYHHDFSCELIRNDYIEDDKHFKNTGVFYENAIKSDYKGYILLRQLLDQFGMRACLKCGNGTH